MSNHIEKYFEELYATQLKEAENKIAMLEEEHEVTKQAFANELASHDSVLEELSTFLSERFTRAHVKETFTSDTCNYLEILWYRRKEKLNQFREEIIAKAKEKGIHITRMDLK